MAILTILIGTGTILIVLLLLMLIILSTEQPKTPNRKKVKEDIKKIKEQINSE